MTEAQGNSAASTATGPNIPAQEASPGTIPVSTTSAAPLSTHQGFDTASETSTGERNATSKKETPVLTPNVPQMSFLQTIDREGITKFINEQGYLTYIVRSVKINSYLKSLMSLAGVAVAVQHLHHGNRGCEERCCRAYPQLCE